jgi:hypothetical protein
MTNDFTLAGRKAKVGETAARKITAVNSVELLFKDREDFSSL